ncbi:hypothetical protein AciPR4_1535 [Terriglobus saanensis SP1PR4]|uniref:Uncharacterized protein n=1 Tax=Terriglobus saanensis (strain ATCC BAA-1853 / DSM 23119 / SP1PR4) TaxID=401053 RepID=E8V1S6_TERSS|nr:hypothetical protein AciPR4_1535 [Terriglobus saanensis SP1PR4]
MIWQGHEWMVLVGGAGLPLGVSDGKCLPGKATLAVPD